MSNVTTYRTNTNLRNNNRFESVRTLFKKRIVEDFYPRILELDYYNMLFFLENGYCESKWWNTWEEDIKHISRLLDINFTLLVSNEYTLRGGEHFYLVTNYKVHHLGTLSEIAFY